MKENDEVLKRVRRIETRLTQFMIAQGVATEHKRPEFDPRSLSEGAGRLTVPSRHTPLSEMIAALPPQWGYPVDIFVGNDLIGQLSLTIHPTTHSG